MYRIMLIKVFLLESDWYEFVINFLKISLWNLLNFLVLSRLVVDVGILVGWGFILFGILLVLYGVC